MVTIVIVNWNSGTQLRECIESIFNYGGSCVSGVVVVDNYSSDNSQEFADDLPGVKLVRNSKNVGFARARNICSKYVVSKYLLFLNPDASLFKDTISDVLSFMDDPLNSAYGICGVQLIDSEVNVLRSCARFPSPLTLFFHSVGGQNFSISWLFYD